MPALRLAVGRYWRWPARGDSHTAVCCAEITTLGEKRCAERPVLTLQTQTRPIPAGTKTAPNTHGGGTWSDWRKDHGCSASVSPRRVLCFCCRRLHKKP